MRMYAVFSSVSLRSLSVSRFVSFTNSCKGISRRVSRLHFGHVRLRLRVFCFCMPKYQQAIPRMAGHTGTSQHSPSRVRTVKGFRVASKANAASVPSSLGVILLTADFQTSQFISISIRANTIKTREGVVCRNFFIHASGGAA